MKKIIISILCFFGIFLSCGKNETVDKPSVKMVPVSFQAILPDTRATLDGLNVSWTAGDIIYITKNASVSEADFSVYPAEKANVYPLTAQANGTSVTFTGYLPEDLNETGCAVYGVPGLYQFYKSSNRINPRWVSQDTQIGIKGGVAPNTIMMFAYTNGVDRWDIDFTGEAMHFRLGCALVKVGVNGSDIKKITLSTTQTAAPSKNYLGATLININLQTGSYGLVSGGDYLNSINLVPNGTEAFESGDYFFAIPAPNLTTGAGKTPTPLALENLKISYTKTDNSVVSKTSEKTLNAVAGKIYKTGIDETKCTE